MTLLKSLVLLFSLSLTAVGCGEAVVAYDCNAVCTRYADCFDDGYDVDACRANCEDEADQSEAHAEQVSGCESCIDDKSCSGSFSCIDECVGIVP